MPSASAPTSSAAAGGAALLRPPIFSMGLATYRVPMSLHRLNRDKVCGSVLAAHPHLVSDGCCIIYVRGGTSSTRNDTDHEPLFRQESYFHYLVGVKEPDFGVLIRVGADGTASTTLLCPRLPEAYEWFMGRRRTCEEYAAMYGTEDARFCDEAGDVLGDMCGRLGAGSTLLLLEGTNSDSGKTYPAPTDAASALALALPGLALEKSVLFPVLSECRSIKSEPERRLLRHVAELTSSAHVAVMRAVQPGMAEWQLEALFRHHAHHNYGCRLLGYTPICACGPSGAVLHYGHAGEANTRTLTGDDMCLLDMGAEYHCYGADITCSYPAGGTFSRDQRTLYSAVLAAQTAVYDHLRPGACWVRAHEIAETQIIAGLLDMGVVILDGEEDAAALVEKRLGAVFMPHGLGHLIGIDTHDVSVSKSYGIDFFNLQKFLVPCSPSIVSFGLRHPRLADMASAGPRGPTLPVSARCARPEKWKNTWCSPSSRGATSSDTASTKAWRIPPWRDISWRTAREHSWGPAG